MHICTHSKRRKWRYWWQTYKSLPHMCRYRWHVNHSQTSWVRYLFLLLFPHSSKHSQGKQPPVVAASNCPLRNLSWSALETILPLFTQQNAHYLQLVQSSTPCRGNQIIAHLQYGSHDSFPWSYDQYDHHSLTEALLVSMYQSSWTNNGRAVSVEDKGERERDRERQRQKETERDRERQRQIERENEWVKEANNKKRGWAQANQN